MGATSKACYNAVFSHLSKFLLLGLKQAVRVGDGSLDRGLGGLVIVVNVARGRETHAHLPPIARAQVRANQCAYNMHARNGGSDGTCGGSSGGTGARIVHGADLRDWLSAPH